MPDVASTDRDTFAHLLRRAGFGPTSAEVDAAVAAGWEATVDRLLDFSGTDPADSIAAPAFAPYTNEAGMSLAQRQTLQKQRAGELRELQLWWLQRMATSTHQLREKLTLYWHGHFATSYVKVQLAQFMYRQNQIFRTLGDGNFETLTQAVAKDPAMMVWLDTRTDKAANPNENFARELMELFTLGIGNYTEDDVREGARAFTGWVINPQTLTWALQVRQHDNGQKTFLGQTGDWGGEDIIHIVANAPAGHAFVVARMWSHFAYPITTSDPLVGELLPAYTKALNVTDLLRAILLHPQFTSTQARTGLVRQPIEWAVGMLRILGLPATSPRLVQGLTLLGQIPFEPPNVGGWPQNDYWLTTASSLARLTFAIVAVGAADLSPISSLPASQRVDAAAQLLSVTWSPSTAAALASVASDPGQLLALAFVAPESVLA